MQGHLIRSRFLEYFARHGHTAVPSASLVPLNDPTLYFVNAGMVPFKDVFTGEVSSSYSRATSAQKCLRVSGKHNDLEAVGRTARHHTFFEMLGNFSFGDYFKQDAITFAWRFLSDEVALDSRRLAATVFAGDDEMPADEEAFTLWRDAVGLEPARIHRLGREDNFWSMGEFGPCGPSSELHYHQGDDLPCREPTCRGVACECDRWIEIWNLVFMQFNRTPEGLRELSQTGVDTGMGLERLAAVSQGVRSNYDTDLLRPLVEAVAALAGKRYGANEADDVSMRVVADHARATAFCIADNVFPEKGGREYVLRRIMRRAIRHGKLLGFEDVFFNRVCERVVDEMGQAYPELQQRRDVILRLAEAEETAFRRTLDRGLGRLAEEMERIGQAGSRELAVKFVGELFDTHGFPIDLTRVIAEEAGLSVDEQAVREFLRGLHAPADEPIGGEAVAGVFKVLTERLGATEFVGYQRDSADSSVLALVRDGCEVSSATEGEAVDVVTAVTPFYGRAGGQVGDTGELISGEATAEVVDTIKPGGVLIVHRARVTRGRLEPGASVELKVDARRRQAIRLNHSATHLLHDRLRAELGTHVAQKGSEVAPQRLRFDFSHFEALSAAQITAIETQINDEIRANLPASTEECAFEQARELGAMALFGEKYGDRVRVVRIGTSSIELCGGTHVERVGDIGLFRIVAEEPLALGVRRIVAVTGAAAVALVQQQEAALGKAAALLKVGPEGLVERVERVVSQLKSNEREISQLKRRLASGGGTDLMRQVRDVGGVKVLATRVEAADPKTLRQAGDTLRDKLGSGVVVLGGEHQGKATLLVMVSKDLLPRLHAGRLVSKLALLLGGRGGGRPDMAQAGGPKIEQLDAALSAVFEQISAG